MDEETQEATAEKEETAVAKTNEEEMDTASMVAGLKGKEKGMEVTGEYFNFEVSKEYRMIVVGSTTMSGMGDQADQTVKAIRFLTEDEQFVVSAAAVVVSTLGPQADKVSAGEAPTFGVHIECTGEKSSSKGKYQTFKIFELV